MSRISRTPVVGEILLYLNAYDRVSQHVRVLKVNAAVCEVEPVDGDKKQVIRAHVALLYELQ